MKKTFLLILCMLLYANLAYAGNSSLPFESALSTISDSLSGPVAMAIGVAAFAVAGIAYLFAPDMNNIVKGLMGVCIALGIVFGGKAMIDLLFKPTSTGCVITIAANQENNKILSDKNLYE